MKRKKVMLELFALFFIAALFLATYVLLEMRGDLLATGGAGIVLLIAAYLLLDSFFDYRAMTVQTNAPVAEPNSSSGSPVDVAVLGKLLQRIAELENIQKAVYTATKKGNAEQLEVLQEIDSRLYELQVALQNMTASSAGGNSNVDPRILQTQQSLLELMKASRLDQQNGTKMIIKYSKENARQIAENAHTNTVMTISELHAMLDPLIAGLAEQGPRAGNLQTGGRQETTEPPVTEALQGLMSDDPNKALSADEIAAMFAAAGQ